MYYDSHEQISISLYQHQLVLPDGHVALYQKKEQKIRQGIYTRSGQNKTTNFVNQNLLMRTGVDLIRRNESTTQILARFCQY